MVTFDYYRIFYYVASYKSMTKAAQMLGNNQPNITRCMNNLESELGCKLMERGNRGILLTPSGQKLYEHVSIAFEQLDSGEKELKKEMAMQSGQVTIAASETALRMVVLPELRTFKKNFPNISIRISNHSAPQAIRTLQSGAADFAVVTNPVTFQRPIVATPLYKFREIPIGGPSYFELAGKEIPLQVLRHQPLISVGRDTGTRELYVQYFMNHHLTFQPELEASSTDQILPMVQYDLGIGFYPEALAHDAIQRKEVCEIHLQEPVPERYFYLATDSSRPLSTAAEYLIRDFQSLIQKPTRPEQDHSIHGAGK